LKWSSGRILNEHVIRPQDPGRGRREKKTGFRKRRILYRSESNLLALSLGKSGKQNLCQSTEGAGEGIEGAEKDISEHKKKFCGEKG